jgi:hypothetical protein
MAYNFSPKTLATLKRAGWHEDRHVDTSEYSEFLRATGVPVHQQAIQFWENFGGLRVVHPHSRVPSAEDYFEINPIQATRRTDIRNLRRFSERVGTPLCIIGEAFRGYMVLLMDATGRVYAGLDNLLKLVGSSGEEAIEALCSGQKLAPLS